MSESNDRPRGILSPDDRRYLKGKKELSEGSEYNTRRRIRERTENALLDFEILLDDLDESEREKIFSVEETRTQGRPLPRDVVDDVIAFLFLGLTDHSPIEERDGGHHSPAFESRLSIGLGRGYRERDLLIHELALQIESERVPGLDEVARMFDLGLKPTISMMASVIELGAVDEDELREFLKEQLAASD